MKKRVTGIFSIGEVMFKNQFGLMGKNLRNSRKKNKLLLFSSTWAKSKNEESYEQNQAKMLCLLHFQTCCTLMYLLLQHGHLVREESHNVLFAERLGQEETESGAHCGEDTGEEKTIPRPKQGPSQDVLES